MNETCIFCDKPISKKLFCEKHRLLFAMQIKFIKNKQLSLLSFNEYYHNLRFSIMKSGTIESVILLSTRLIALSYIKYKETGDLTLLDKSIIDVKSIYSNKTNFLFSINNKMEEYKKGSLNDFDIRCKWPTNFVACDGHKVRSLGELFIDNWLFYHNYKHCYEKKLYYEDKFILTDFFLEKENIFIEYCGKKDKDYLIRKKAQKEYYESLNLKIIYFDYDDLKRFDDIFEEKIRKLL